ncbi:unnamed protein product [Schistosoma margrebowiei]|uniref:Rad21/Rec8-like protein N-terminal domain-containing protein n=1 Tax=Schistosoma margrebowiei TaxID=48269 RepID=A0AA85A0S4_9TREM|nr:unnamed protein product [Schistosoma margrebowiei]
MFYSIDLLSAHRGKFGIIWLAATRVRKQLSRKELNSVNIVTACNEITSYILGETQLRLSLYLASQLTFGICIIYREKTIVMLRDLQELSQKASVTTSRSIDLPTCTKSRTKRKTRVPIDDPEVPLLNLYNETNDFGNLQLPDLFWPSINEPCLDFMDTQTLYQARNEDITLVEDPSVETTGTRFSFGEDFLPEFILESTNRDHHTIQPVDLIPIEIQNGKRHISKHLVHESEAEVTEYSAVERSCYSDKPQRPITTIQEKNVIFDSVLNQFVPVRTEIVNSPKDLTNAKTLAQGSADECTVPQSFDVPMDSVNAPITTIQEKNVIFDSVLNQFVPVRTEIVNSPKDLTNAKTLAQGSADECTVPQSFDVPMDSVNAISANVDSSLMPSEIISNSTHLENIKQSNVVLEQVELTRDFLTETEMTQILPQEEEERTFTSASEQNICPISLSRLNPLNPVESEENTHRRRTKKHSNKLIIDKITRLTASELRWNMLHGEETMVTRDFYLAESTPRSQTRHLLSRSVSRLFSVPGNLETALSLRLCDLWCYHRRLCEKALQKRKLDDLSINNDVIQTKRPAKSLSIKMNAITEENESSVEIQRLAGDHSSLIGSESIFGTSNIIDVTNNQTTSVRESLVQMKESFGGASDQPIPDIVTNVRDNTASEITRQALDLPIPGTSISLPTECTTLVPVIEEPEENLQQQNELDSTSVVPNLTEALPDQFQLPIEVSSLSGKRFHDKSQLWRYLHSQLIESNSCSIDIENLCPLGCSKKQAAFVFMTLLEFAKNRQIILSQSVAFGQILITIIH